MRILLFVLLPLNALAQNLVLNPGFEDVSDTLRQPSDCFSRAGVINWYTPNIASTDCFVFTPGDSYTAMRTATCGGAASPFEGNAMAGFIAWTAEYEYREYVGGTFSEPLAAGKTYEVSLTVMLGTECLSGVGEIGLYTATKKETDIPHHNTLTDHTPVAVFKTDSPVNLAGRWVTMLQRFTAKGGERYFLIGNFSTDKNTRITPGKTSGNGFHWAYYFIDAVSIQPAGGKMEIASEKTGNITEIAAGKTLIAQHINFETDQSTLLAQSYPPLYSILAALKNQPNLHVAIEGHTDSTGTESHNKKLSEARAKAVAEFFISNGIAANRVTWKGYGETQPLGNDDSQNRRVEFVFSE